MTPYFTVFYGPGPGRNVRKFDAQPEAIDHAKSVVENEPSCTVQIWNEHGIITNVVTVDARGVLVHDLSVTPRAG